ncbi:MAG: hypothetical protein V1921_01685 [Candidatus Altiarchaeota archaeon]
MIVSDASSIISLAMNCMSNVLSLMEADIAITPAVYDEIFTRPVKTKKFALEALRIKKLFAEGTIHIVDEDHNLTDRILDLSNSIYSAKGKNIRIVHKGEAAALALMCKLNADALLIDERTTRLLIEDPDSLRGLLNHRTGESIRMDNKRLSELSRLVGDTPIIRSAEIAFRAYEMNLLDDFNTRDYNVLDAMLYALKFSGCAISWDEIEEYIRIRNS